MKHNQSIIDGIKRYCMDKPGAYETRPFGTYPICYRVMGKIFAQLNPEEKFYKLTLKCEPEQADFYRQVYDGVVVRGYHCPPVQQPYWNTIDLYSFDDMEVLYQMIDEAYDALLKKFSKKLRGQLSVLSQLEFRVTDGKNADFALLCGKLDKFLDDAAGDKSQRYVYDQYNKRDNIHDVIVVYQNSIPIACGAFKMYDNESAELKRIYTDTSVRNRGIGSELIRRLEALAKIQGYRFFLLETGRSLQSANRMYKKAGYKEISNYGQYEDMYESICMVKKI